MTTISDLFASFADADRAQEPGLKGGGGPVGLHACGRASLDGPNPNINWATACCLWDRLRQDIRRIADPATESAAWQLAVDAFTELRADFDQQFRNGPEDKEEGR